MLNPQKFCSAIHTEQCFPFPAISHHFPALPTTKRPSELSGIQCAPYQATSMKTTQKRRNWDRLTTRKCQSSWRWLFPAPCPEFLRRLVRGWPHTLGNQLGRSQEVRRGSLCPPGWAGSQPLLCLNRWPHLGPGWLEFVGNLERVPTPRS